ncbi:DUF6691 family protein [Stenotrophomonas sp. PD6]|uniref:DUF6691 family protein n=1 Tax=Stenotrophomonas sp. PD6 TaxID=3368612 RepID=UPI003BA11230
MSRLVALLCGALFGVGLVVADMANPARVLAFLDVTGNWDVSLGLVMVGALVPSGLAYAWVRRRQRPLLPGALHLPTQRGIDRRLLSGAAVFGVGWGLMGICPGPAVVLLGTGEPLALVFFAAMMTGMAFHALLHRTRLRRGAMPSSRAGREP